MDKRKTGRFIASHRRALSMTQEELGERVGVSYKTVSRWETGVYMPDIEALEALAETFSVTIDEIIAGEDNNIDNIKEKGAQTSAGLKRENGTAPHEVSASSFTDKERIEYFKQKWLRDHALSMLMIYAVIIAAWIFGVVRHLFAVVVIMSLAAAVTAVILRNSMMSYVESRVWDRKLNK